MFRVSRFSLVVVTTLAVILIACALPTPQARPLPDPPLKFGHSTWVGYGPFYIARDKGFFAEEGVQVELTIVEDPKSRFAALAAGQLDGLASTLDTMTLYWKPDNQFTAVLAVDDSHGGDGIVARKDIASVADLKGKKVAFAEGSVSHFYLSYLLDQAGLAEADIIPVNMTAGDAGSAFVAEQVDAAVTWEPWLSRGKEAAHGQILVDSSTTPGLIVDVVIFRKDVLERRGEDIRRFIRAYNRAVEFWKSNRDEAVAIMAGGVGGWLEDPKEFEATLTGVTLFGKAENAQFFAGRAQETVSFAIELWTSKGAITEALKAEDLLNNSFLEQ
jgi:NitT/TauT family transport system substrate-binding protein